MTLAITIIFSAIVSLTLVPSLCGLFLRHPKEPKPEASVIGRKKRSTG